MEFLQNIYSCLLHLGQFVLDLFMILCNIIVDLGEIAGAFLQVTVFVGKVVLFIHKQPLPIKIVLIVIIILLIHYFKYTAMIIGGIWFSRHMSLAASQVCGIIIAVSGGIFQYFSIRRFFLLREIKKIKKEKKKKKKKD